MSNNVKYFNVAGEETTPDKAFYASVNGICSDPRQFGGPGSGPHPGGGAKDTGPNFDLADKVGDALSSLQYSQVGGKDTVDTEGFSPEAKAAVDGADFIYQQPEDYDGGKDMVVVSGNTATAIAFGQIHSEKEIPAKGDLSKFLDGLTSR